MVQLKLVSGKVIVVTGASSGIGRAIALMAVRRGVVVAARGAGAVERLAAFAVQRFGVIDTWVNNTGVAIADKLEDLGNGDARRVFAVNFWRMVRGCRAALPHLEAQGGVIVNLGSVISDVTAPLMGLYLATKQAIKAYCDALRIVPHVLRAVLLCRAGSRSGCVARPGG